MPLFEFTCETCGTFEVWRSVDDISATVTCPACGVRCVRSDEPHDLPSEPVHAGWDVPIER